MGSGIIRFKKSENAVAEIIGTTLLIGMAVSAFAAVSLVVLNPYLNQHDLPPPQVTIVGSELNEYSILEHRGGYSLPLDTKIIITTGGMPVKFKANLWINDTNGNGKWDIGERIEYKNSAYTEELRVEATVIDVETNSIIMQGILHDGIVITKPTVITLPVDPNTDIGEGWVRLSMYYNFLNYTGEVRFMYGPDNSSWVSSDWEDPLYKYGIFSQIFYDIGNDTSYVYAAQLKYIVSGEEKIIWGDNLTFIPLDWVRGLWLFDENFGPAIDASIHENNGILMNGTLRTTGIEGRALQFDGNDDYVTCGNNNSLNLTEKISITAWINPSSEEIFGGELNGFRTYNLSNYGFDCFEPDIIHVGDMIYAIAYRSPLDGQNSYITTIKVDEEGLVSKMQEVELNVPFLLEPDFIHLHGDYYAVVYGSVDTSYIFTMNINGDYGSITQIREYNLMRLYGHKPRIINLYKTRYAIVFGGSSSPLDQTGYLITVEITDEGEFLEITDQYKLPQSEHCLEADIIKVQGEDGLYAIVFGTGSIFPNGYIITIKISSLTGDISKSYLSSGVFNTFQGIEPSIIYVSGDVYAISFGSSSEQHTGGGWLATFKIESGKIVSSATGIFRDTFNYPTPFCLESDIALVDDNLFLITYGGTEGGDGSSDVHGYAFTISIDDEGLFGDNIIDNNTFSERGVESDIIIVDVGSTEDYQNFLVAYGEDKNNGGFLVTMKVNTSGDIVRVISKGDSYGIKLSKTSFIGYINSKTITVNCKRDCWNFIVITYNKNLFYDQLKIYYNGSLIKYDDYSESISTNYDDLEFGTFKGKLDIVGIYNKELTPIEILNMYYGIVPPPPS